MALEHEDFTFGEGETTFHAVYTQLPATRAEVFNRAVVRTIGPAIAEVVQASTLTGEAMERLLKALDDKTLDYLKKECLSCSSFNGKSATTPALFDAIFNGNMPSWYVLLGKWVWLNLRPFTRGSGEAFLAVLKAKMESKFQGLSTSTGTSTASSKTDPATEDSSTGKLD